MMCVDLEESKILHLREQKLYLIELQNDSTKQVITLQVYYKLIFK